MNHHSQGTDYHEIPKRAKARHRRNPTMPPPLLRFSCRKCKEYYCHCRIAPTLLNHQSTILPSTSTWVSFIPSPRLPTFHLFTVVGYITSLCRPTSFIYLPFSSLHSTVSGHAPKLKVGYGASSFSVATVFVFLVEYSGLLQVHVWYSPGHTLMTPYPSLLTLPLHLHRFHYTPYHNPRAIVLSNSGNFAYRLWYTCNCMCSLSGDRGILLQHFIPWRPRNVHHTMKSKSSCTSFFIHFNPLRIHPHTSIPPLLLCIGKTSENVSHLPDDIIHTPNHHHPSLIVFP